MIKRRMLALATVAVVAVAACGDGRCASAPPGVPRRSAGRGPVTVLVWPGYVENGSTDPSVDWVTPFQEETGCQVDFQLWHVGQGVQPFATNPDKYDVISASATRACASCARATSSPSTSI